jgi:hypothetical protein
MGFCLYSTFFFLDEEAAFFLLPPILFSLSKRGFDDRNPRDEEHQAT